MSIWGVEYAEHFVGLWGSQRQIGNGPPAWTIDQLFTSGELGFWYEMKPENLYQDNLSTVPVVSVGDPVFRGHDLSVNNLDFYAVAETNRPLYQADDSLLFDNFDDRINVDFGVPFIGTVWVKTSDGVFNYEIDTPSTWTMPVSVSGLHGNNIGPMVAVEGSVVEPRVAEYMGGGGEFAGVTSMYRWFMLRSDIVKLYSANWDTSSVTDMGGLFLGCSGLTTLDVSNWNVTNVTIFSQFANNCTELTTLDVSTWDMTNTTSYGSFFDNCRKLTALDVSNWNVSDGGFFANFAKLCRELTTLDVSTWDTTSAFSFRGFVQGCSVLTALDVSNWNTANVNDFGLFIRSCPLITSIDVSNWVTSSVTTFDTFALSATSLTTVIVNGGTGNPFTDSPCTDYNAAFNDTNLSQQSIDDILVAIELAGTSSGVFGQSGGSAPSATGNTAIDALRARGWTITVTGGY